MTRYSLPVMLSEQFYAVVIMPSKDITMQDIKISSFQSDFFCLVLPSSSCLSPVLPSEESQKKNLTTTTMISISTTITVPITFTEQSGGISCRAV